ncbi:acyl-CoA dehydrogenase family protein [Planomonospora venezuelensis]|uniref:Acyl-CoA dehydrogenase n=1 Tax=Planomonospora venezuelensis TaxID=1999 RepID=A0A841DCW8_PLAVE|nr:acyl-CoA dehydrogenase family protein [Planomonospora venezuelensis]MBB5966637.1 acyl-CoA dehydrogenase [Planomonospora venezuelensis]GIN03510.1 acyl-CoA dehydrogenase [Planomonospora venezuelensis]
MKLVLTPEQRELREAVRGFLSGASPLPAVRAAMDSETGYDPAVYRRLNGELGLSGLIVPEEYGGAGAGFAELAVALEETGAALLPGPFLATTAAAIALTQLQTPDKELLGGIAEGRVTAAFAPASGVTAGTADGDGRAALSGTVPHLLNGLDADVLLVEAAAPDGPVLVAVEAGGAGVAREALTTLDPTRRQARVTFDGSPGRILSGADEAGLARARDLLAVAVAAEQLGVLRASLDAIVAYSKIRVAFNRLIGSYQGVKHKLADMHCKLEQAESVVRYAAWTADEAPGELPAAAALAQVYLGRACFEVARDSLLLHGGIGFTWEHDAHLFYKRAKADEVLLGPPRAHRTRLADLLEL